MAYIDIKIVTDTSITADISGLSNPQNTYGGFRMRINGGAWVNLTIDSGYTGFDSANYTFSMLSSGVTYTIEGEAYTNDWYPATSAQATTTVPDPIVNITFSNVTSSGFTVNYTAFSPIGISAVSCYVDGLWEGDRTTASGSFIITGKSPSTQYKVEVGANDTASPPNSGWDTDFVTTLAKSKPSSFSWSTPKVATQPFNLTATEWTALQNKCNEWLDYKGLSQFSFYSTYNGDGSFTIANSGGTFYYYFFNQVRNAISLMNPSVPASVVSKQAITASMLNALVTSINAIT